MKNWIVALGTLAMVSGCSPVVLEPLQGTQGAQTSSGGGGAPGGGGGGPTVLAIRGGDVQWSSPFPAPFSFNQPWSDPDSLVLFFSTDTQECGDPVLAPRCIAGDQFWQAIIAIPPELVHPGLISMEDPRIKIVATRSFPDGSPVCSSGGFEGPSLAGVLELITDGSSTLSVKLSGGVEPLGDATIDGVPKGSVLLDGEYTAQLCGALPAILPPTPALALRGIDVPTAPGVATPDPDSLVVFLGTLPDTCQDPWAAVDCSTGVRLTFTLPPALQTPGVISLSDPAIASTYTFSAGPPSATCGAPSGPFPEGTVEILSSDAGGLTFKVYQTFSASSSPSGWLAFDGLYSASICP